MIRSRKWLPFARVRLAAAALHCIAEPMEQRLLMTSTSWKGGAGNWDVPGNWTNGLPSSTVDAVITATGSSVTINDNESVASLTLAKPLTIVGGGTLSVFTGISLNSTLTLTSAGEQALLNINDSPTGAVLSGTGTVLMGGTDPSGDYIRDVANEHHPVTIPAGWTIQGAGYLELNYDGTVGIDFARNLGTISADISGQILHVGTSSDGFINKNKMSAVNGGTLSLESYWSNTGTVTETASTLDLSGIFTQTGTITRSGGTVNMPGTYNLAGGPLALTAATGSWNMSGGTLENGAVNLSGGATLLGPNDNFTDMTLGSDITIPDGGTLNINGQFNLGGHVLTMSANSGQTTLNLNDSATGTILSGSGTVFMGGVNPSLNYFRDVANQHHPVTIPAGWTIHGAGFLELNYDGAVGVDFGKNLGVISADTAGQTLHVGTASDGFINQGKMSAMNGGTLSFESYWSNTANISETNSTLVLAGTFTQTGTINRSGGTVNMPGTYNLSGATLALNASTGSWNTTGGTLENGTLNLSGGAALSGTNDTLTNITLASDFTITDAETLSLSGTFNLGGHVLTLASKGDQTLLNFNDGATGTILAGTGTVFMGGTTPAENTIRDVANQHHPVTIPAGWTIHGAGYLELNYDGTVGVDFAKNLGTIAADTAGQILHVGTSSDGFINQGIMSVVTGATLSIESNATFAAGGTITGTGTVAGNITNAGTIAAGSPSFGTLTINGTLTETSTGSIKVNLAGTTSATTNKLVVTGAVTAAGIVDVYTLNSFHPASGNSFNVLSYPSITGTFGSDGTSLGGGIALTATVGSTSTSLKAIAPPADTTAPTESAFTLGTVNGGGTAYTFTVTYADNIAIDDSTLGSGNVTVTGPNKFTAAAALVSISKTNNGTPRTATYSITPPGGSWDGADNGTYTITLNGSSVKDTKGNAVAGKTLGTFTVAIPHLVYSVQPATVVAGKAIAPSVVVKIEDSSGNVITTDSSKVTIAIANGPSGAVISGTFSVSASKGIATFSNLLLTKAGSYALKATDGGDGAVTSSSFTVNPGAAAKLVFMQQPVASKVGKAITPAVTVLIEDALGNIVTTNTTTVKLATATAPTGGTLTGTVSVSAIAGKATFSNLLLSKAGSYSLKATDGSLTAVTSSVFAVS